MSDLEKRSVPVEELVDGAAAEQAQADEAEEDAQMITRKSATPDLQLSHPDFLQLSVYPTQRTIMLTVSLTCDHPPANTISLPHLAQSNRRQQRECRIQIYHLPPSASRDGPGAQVER